MNALEHKLLEILSDHVSAIMAKSILSLSVSWSRVDLENLPPPMAERLLKELEKGVKLYIREPAPRGECARRLRDALLGPPADGDKGKPAEPEQPKKGMTLPIASEPDIVLARGAGREVCQDLGFSPALQIKVATAISELARNIVQYAGEGQITITVLKSPRTGIEVLAKDNGGGIPNLEEVLSGGFRSKRGMGVGLAGTKKLMDDFEIETSAESGTRIVIRKYL